MLAHAEFSHPPRVLWPIVILGVGIAFVIRRWDTADR